MVNTILVVDDEHDCRATMAEALRARGHFVLEARDGREALDLLLGDGVAEPRVIVVDLAMPIMSGWELLAIVKSYFRLARIPVVAVSGKEKPEAAMRLGAIDEFVQKPHEPEALVAVVEGWIGKFARVRKPAVIV